MAEWKITHLFHSVLAPIGWVKICVIFTLLFTGKWVKSKFHSKFFFFFSKSMGVGLRAIPAWIYISPMAEWLKCVRMLDSWGPEFNSWSGQIIKCNRKNEIWDKIKIQIEIGDKIRDKIR
jgi:hypothetical protein